MDMTNAAAAALAIIPILSFLCFVAYVYATCSQEGNDEQRNDYK
jgi:hypothetical protein